MFAPFFLCLLLLWPRDVLALSEEGVFVGGTQSLAIELVQLGGYGRLTLKSSGHGDMRYGRCRTNFHRDPKGLLHHSPFRADGTARCPQTLGFTLNQSERGLYRITFAKGGLEGESFTLAPRLLPMERRFADKMPEGFDILGLSPDMSRADLETRLRELGFSLNPLWSMRRGQPDLFAQSLELWTKGASEADPSQPAESIAITYSAVFPDHNEEKALHISRKWVIPFFDQPLAALTEQALDAKYGATTSGLSTRFYDKSGRLQPQARLPFCAPDIHLQKVALFVVQEGLRESRAIAAACGSWVEIGMTASRQRPGRIEELRIALYRSDLAYADYWQIWSRFEAEILRRDYLEHMGRAAKPPDL